MSRTDDDELQHTYAEVSRRILPLLLLGYLVAYLDRVNVGFAKLQMMGDLRLNDATYGLGAGIFFIGYFLFEVPSNMILHRVGARVWISRIMISWGAVSVAMMFVTTPGTFYALRFLLGATEAGFFPGVIFYLTQWYPVARRGRIIALFMTAVPISSALGSILSGWVMETFHGVNHWAGWQWLFLIEGAPAILLGFYVWTRLADRVEQATWLTARQKSLLEAALTADAGEQPARSFSSAFRSGRVWFACVVYFCLVVGLYGIGFWLPTVIGELGVRGALHIGLVTAIPYTVATVGMIYVGKSADRRGERRLHVAIPAAAGAVGLALSALTQDHPVLAVVALTVATFGVFTAPPLFWGLPTAFLRGAAAAAGIAIINCFGNLAGFVSPYLIGWIRTHTHSTQLALFAVAAFVLIGAGLVMLGRWTMNTERFDQVPAADTR